MLPKNVLYYGKGEPLPERIALRAGPLRLFYEGGDLRYIRYGGREILRRIYVAIRDRNWGTVPPVFSNLQMEIGSDSFFIRYDVENKQGEIDFTWRGTITGTAQGTVSFSMDGVARSTFLRNRIGFCVLHPAGCAGAPCRVRHVDGSTEWGILPVWISADQPVLPFAEMQSLVHEVQPGAWAEVLFSGDLFEMEDQRNWTDASYKTFCTPLCLPYPVEFREGTHISQAITLRIQEEGPAAHLTEEAIPAGPAPLHLRLDRQGLAVPLPLLGLGTASHGQLLSELELSRLKALNLDHLRLDLHLGDPGYPARLAQAAGEARALGIPLDVALLLSPEDGVELKRLRNLLDRIRPEVSTWLVYPRREVFQGGSPTRQVLELAREHLAGWSTEAKFAAGTNTDFIFMQRTPPPFPLLDRVTLAINPQVHAFDNASLVESLEAQAVVVSSARRLAGGLPVMVSPVTFKPRFNPYAAGPELETPPGGLPPQVDLRQSSLFGAGWTASSLKYLALGGACRLTYYETTGWRGVMETAAGSSLPGVFHSIPGGVFPLYHVLAEAAGFTGGEVLPVQSSDPLQVDGLALRKGDRLSLVLASFAAESRCVTLTGLGSEARVRSLDETNVEEAMRSPEVFRALPGELCQVLEGKIELELKPYSLAWLDA